MIDHCIWTDGPPWPLIVLKVVVIIIIIIIITIVNNM